MQKFDLTHEDHELITAAVEAVKQPVLQIYNEKAPALVGAALRLENGKVFTALNLIADVGSISMCAEPQAIAHANRFPEHKITTIVSVYYQKGREPMVIPPCGRCREVITDFSQGYVIMRDPGTNTHYKVKAIDLLPYKYGEYWNGDTLI